MNSWTSLPALLTLAALGPAAALQAQDNGLDVGVRSVVDNPAALLAKPLRLLKAGESGGKTFAFYPAIETKSSERIVRPLKAAAVMAIMGSIQEKLVARGFQGVVGHERPDMVVIVEYGRGYLPNPYSDAQLQAPDGQMLNGAPASAPEGKSPFNAAAARSSVTGLPSMKRLEPGHEGKLQAANQEKLYITVSAFDFFSMQKGQKPKRIWQTVMNVDDPDHRDLNQIYNQMIAAGGPHFAQPIKQEELQVTTSLRDGRVEVGVPQVVEDTKSQR